MMIVAYAMIAVLAIAVGLLLVLLLDSVFLAGVIGFIVGVGVTAFMVAWSGDDE